MDLTPKEKKMAQGAYGKALKTAMDILITIGELNSAERMLPITQAHIDGCSYAAVWDAGLDFAEMLASSGAKVAVPTTLNITARDIDNWKHFGVPADHAEKCRRMEAAYYEMGCIPTWTCAPYQYGIVPRFGEHIAWSESNAVNYANSVLGARSNRNGDLVDICCAITGSVPEYGLHLTKNRAGQVVIRFEGLDSTILCDHSAYAAAGYIAGKIAGDKIPVLDGLPFADNEDLKAMSAAAASSGAVGLFHVVGVTPEASTLEAALQGNPPDQVVTIDRARFQAEYEMLTCGKAAPFPMLVVIGCPHASYSEIEKIADLLAGQKIKDGVAFWIQTNQTVKHLLMRTGLFDTLEESGIKLMCDGCILNYPMDSWGFKTVVTNSGKMAHYAPGHMQAGVFFKDTARCTAAAISGKVCE